MADISVWKRKEVWVAAAPILLSLMALGSTVKMLGDRSGAERQWTETKQAQRDAQTILGVLKEMGGAVSGEVKLFDPVQSARACAAGAGIGESRLIRLESAKPDRQKDGSWLHTETYKLTGVHLVQTAQFMDHAERDYAFLSCTQMALTQVRSKAKDTWDATVTVKYLVK